MKICILLFTLVCVSCISKGEEKNKKKYKELMSQKDTIRSFEIPEELKTKIDSNIVFAIAEIGLWEGDYSGNTLYVLYKDRSIKRIQNESLPADRALYDSELSQFFITDISKYHKFVRYLHQLSGQNINSYNKTPSNLKVSGGVIHYFYIRGEEKERWIVFEPESQNDKIREIKNNFSKMVVNE